MSAGDARISTGLPNHPKTKKLIRRLGAGGGWFLVRLFLWAAQSRPDGDLAGMTYEDIELAVDWDGAEGSFVSALVAVGFLDQAGSDYRIHDWADHNPWASGAPQRSAKARWNAIKRHHGVAEADRQVPEYAAVRGSKQDAASSATSSADSIAPALQKAGRSNAPSPSPSLKASDPIGSGADAPPGPDPLWHTGLRWLRGKGVPEPQARSYLGKLRKQVGDVEASALLARAEAEDVSDPIPWLSAAAMNARASPRLSKTAQGIAALEDMKREALRRMAVGGDPDGVAEVGAALPRAHARG